MTKWDQLNRQIVTCEKCPRLRKHCQRIAEEKRRAYLDWDYWGRPVPNFGDPRGKLLIVGLAPGAHGANRTGRMFTGDRSGDWLYRALDRAGYASQAESVSVNDGLALFGCSITAVCHCAPPDNKPTAEEVEHCRDWFQQTVDLVKPRVFLALGQLAWRAVIELARSREWYAGKLPKFGHGATVDLIGQRYLIGSYHPSQQNTFTGRLTEKMLDDVFAQIRKRMTQN
ncbi:MAG: uracil-DNA glycosylase [Planctomycetaceae bacterium]|nr:uracil-DNA glycosylase [Planctomycetaceae bacterium]